MPPSNSVKDSGYLTPDDIPEVRNKRTFSIPDDTAWLGAFMGALAPLMDSEAWRKFGALEPEQAAEEFQEIFFSWQELACGCELPGGSRIIRLNPATGKVEELPPDGGAWQPPTGDYAIPPVPAREGGTPQDEICLAAANCANVLSILYESITDSISAGLSDAEALAAMIEAFILAVGAEFAPIAFAIAAFFLVVFSFCYSVISFLTADLWTADFTKTLVCILVNCASNDAGVVTFDWQCVQHGLASTTNPFTLTLDQLRLLAQIWFIVECIGGADALNQAGATTAITEYDCSECPTEAGCYQVPLTDGEPSGVHIFNGVYEGALGYQQVCLGGAGSTTVCNVGLLITGNGSPCQWTRFEIDVEVFGDNAIFDMLGLNVDDPSTSDFTEMITVTLSAGTHTIGVDLDHLPYYGVRMYSETAAGCGTSSTSFLAVRIRSDNLSVAGLEANC